MKRTIIIPKINYHFVKSEDDSLLFPSPLESQYLSVKDKQ